MRLLGNVKLRLNRTLKMPQKVKQERWWFWGWGGRGTGVGNANPVIGDHTPNHRRQLWEGEAEKAPRGK